MMIWPDPMLGYDLRDRSTALDSSNIDGMINDASAHSVIKIPNGTYTCNTTINLDKAGIQVVCMSHHGVYFSSSAAGATVAIAADECVLWGSRMTHNNKTGSRMTITASRCVAMKPRWSDGATIVEIRPLSGAANDNMVAFGRGSLVNNRGMKVGEPADTGQCNRNVSLHCHWFRYASGGTGGGEDWYKGTGGHTIAGDRELFDPTLRVRPDFQDHISEGGYQEQAKPDASNRYVGDSGGSGVWNGQSDWFTASTPTSYRGLAANLTGRD